MSSKKIAKGSGVDSAQIEQLPIESVIPYARNSRTHSESQVAQIAGSIQEFGFCNPVLIDAEGVIIAGHGRVMAAQRLKLATVPCLRLSHLTDAQKRAYVIADNRIALSSGWDEEMLANELSDLHADEFDMALLGFDVDELAGLLKLNEDESAAMPAGEVVEDEVPEAPVDPITKPGNLWILGEHRLLCGDSTKAEDVGRLMAGAKADLCFTSPPYADQRTYTGDGKLSTEHLAKFISAAAQSCDLFCVNLGVSRKDGRVNQYWNDYIEAAEASGRALVSWNVWDRSGEGGSIGNMTAPFPINHEWIFVFSRTSPNVRRTIPNKHGGKKVGATIRAADSTFAERESVVHEFGKLGTVLHCGVQRGQNEHPAMFPVALPASYIEACSDTGNSVYEPFCGSGSTLIAAEQLNRRCYGMEISPAYCDVIVKRWENLTGKTAVLEAA